MRLLLAIALFVCAGTTLASTRLAFAQSEPLQPGDTVQISVWQDPKLDRQVVVGPDGMISFPLAGHIKAGGITTQALENLLRARLQKNYTGKLDITVSLAAVNPTEAADNRPRVYISGEVLKPGPYPAKPPIDVAQAIALAGGLSPFGASRRIQIHRKVQGADTVLVFDYKAFQSGTGAPENNIRLQSGDVVIVPERGLLE
jgi:polysaccharide export outer membrane protein